MILNVTHRRFLPALAFCAAGIPICVCYFDRPAAEFLNSHVRPYSIWIWLNDLLAPLVLIPVVALLVQFGAGFWLFLGRRLASWARASLLFSSGIIWAIAAEFALKRICGRGSPDPTYLGSHLYGFRFFHGGGGWDSFPSGTSTIALTIVTITGLRFPRWRLPVSILAGFVCIGVTVTNGHWVSDVIAGVFLGTCIGWMTVAISENS